MSGRREVLITRRKPNVHLGGVWELPGGKVHPGEAPADAARRELAEETALVLSPGSLEELVRWDHDYPDRRLRFVAFLARVPTDAEPCPLDSGGCRWVNLAEFREIDFPAANAPVTTAVTERLAPP